MRVHDNVERAVRDAFGDRRTIGMRRLEGGSNKGVYRLAFADGGTCVLYRWHADEGFWPDDVAVSAGPLRGGLGRDGFLARHSRLRALGVRVPKVLAVSGDDLALIEDLSGGSLEALLARDPAAGREALAELRADLMRMHSATGLTPEDPTPCEETIAERGRKALAEAASRVPRIAEARTRLGYALSTRLAAVTPRSARGLIHGELGPDHVFLDTEGRPVLIDLDGSVVFDPEWEHAFMELRFGDHYARLRTVELDPARMDLYRLVHHLSLVAGPLQLLDGDFPDRDFMLGIAAWHTEKVLAY